MQELEAFVPLPIKNMYSISGTHHVYILRIEFSNAILYKIGMTSNIPKRIKSLSSLEKPSSVVRGKDIVITSIVAIAKASFTSMAYASQYENYLLRKYAKYRYKGSAVLASGNSELFTHNIFELTMQ